MKKLIVVMAILFAGGVTLVACNSGDASASMPKAFKEESVTRVGSNYLTVVKDKKTKCKYIVAEYANGGNLSVTQMLGKDGLPVCK